MAEAEADATLSRADAKVTPLSRLLDVARWDVSRLPEVARWVARLLLTVSWWREARRVVLTVAAWMRWGGACVW